MSSATDYGATTTFSFTNSSRGKSIDQIGQMTPMSQLTKTKTSDTAHTAERWPESVPPNIYGLTPLRTAGRQADVSGRMAGVAATPDL